VNYSSLGLDTGLTADGWEAVVRDALVDRWTAEYAEVTSWVPKIVDIELGTFVYLFDAASTSSGAEVGGDDRVVVVWGRSPTPVGCIYSILRDI
jgi:hypothetical protein